MEVGELNISLIEAYDNYTERKIIHYELVIVRCERYIQKIINDEIIDLPECKSIIRTKITKTQARQLLEDGYKVVSGYTLSGS